MTDFSPSERQGEHPKKDAKEILREEDDTRELFQKIADSNAQSAERFERALRKAGVYQKSGE